MYGSGKFHQSKLVMGSAKLVTAQSWQPTGDKLSMEITLLSTALLDCELALSCGADWRQQSTAAGNGEELARVKSSSGQEPAACGQEPATAKDLTISLRPQTRPEVTLHKSEAVRNSEKSEHTEFQAHGRLMLSPAFSFRKQTPSKSSLLFCRKMIAHTAGYSTGMTMAHGGTQASAGAAPAVARAERPATRGRSRGRRGRACRVGDCSDCLSFVSRQYLVYVFCKGHVGNRCYDVRGSLGDLRTELSPYIPVSSFSKR